MYYRTREARGSAGRSVVRMVWC